jgi:hypothetical protein
VNGSPDNQATLADPSSFTSESSSLFSSNSSLSLDASGDFYTLEAQLPLVTQPAEQVEKFQRLLSRLSTVYNHSNMSTTALPPSSSHITDRYLFRSLSHDNNPNRKGSSRKNKLINETPATDSSVVNDRKRYKFSDTVADLNTNSVYKFPNGQLEPRSHSTDSSRYYFPSDDSVKKSQQTLTYVRSGNGLEQRSMTFIGGSPAVNDKISLPSTKSIPNGAITTDTPYLFSKPNDAKERYPSATSSSVNPEGKQRIR